MIYNITSCGGNSNQNNMSFHLIRLPKMNDSTTVWESKEQWELSYNSCGSEN